ncbi:transposase domain-containing protein, partial [Streptomyces sp. NPDC056638]|uniref:transposase domain-containing protein n=2 Tax=unclassified Streptomyces TaxID=2593676 RepID=UPI0036A02E32
MLTRAFPPELVDEVVAECGRTEERQRLLPARVVMYFVLAMCLFSGQGYEEVGRLLTQGLERERRWSKTWRVHQRGDRTGPVATGGGTDEGVVRQGLSARGAPGDDGSVVSGSAVGVGGR